jgi:hypothetical protein
MPYKDPAMTTPTSHAPKTRKPRLTWCKQPNESGLARVAQSPRGAILKVDGKVAARVDAVGGGPNQFRGWSWAAGWDMAPTVPHHNAFPGYGKPLPQDIEVAKAAARAYVEAALAKALTTRPRSAS